MKRAPTQSPSVVTIRHELKISTTCAHRSFHGGTGPTLITEALSILGRRWILMAAAAASCSSLLQLPRRPKKWITRAKLGLSPAGARVSPGDATRRDPLCLCASALHRRCIAARAVYHRKEIPEALAALRLAGLYTDPPRQTPLPPPQSRLYRDHPELENHPDYRITHEQQLSPFSRAHTSRDTPRDITSVTAGSFVSISRQRETISCQRKQA